MKESNGHYEYAEPYSRESSDKLTSATNSSNTDGPSLDTIYEDCVVCVYIVVDRCMHTKHDSKSQPKNQLLQL